LAYELKRGGALVDRGAPSEAVEFERRLKGAGLLTAEVLYYMPDHPSLLQTFLWQTMDEAPKFPRLAEFLDHWRREIEAVIHSVRVAHGEPLDVPGWRNASGVLRIH
jgi:uncharacterized protein Usg